MQIIYFSVIDCVRVKTTEGQVLNLEKPVCFKPVEDKIKHFTKSALYLD